MKQNLMKQNLNSAQISRAVLWLGLILCVGLATVRAQSPPNGTVIPRACVAGITNQDGTVYIAEDIPAGLRNTILVNEFVPVNSYIVINPGGANQQSGIRVTSVSGTVAPYTLSIGLAHYPAHQAGEPVTFQLREYEVSWGYQNLSAASVTIQRGISTGNYFYPGPPVYTQQTTNFLPGIHDNVFSTKIASQLAAAVTWYLNGSTASGSYNQPARCGTISYQGRLSDAGAAANGQFDLQFEAFDNATGGTAQSGLIKLEDVQVINGIFTVQLNFGSSFNNNFNARFLEIGVRAGTSTDAFTTLTPRQQLTQVPYAVNAQTAQTAFDVRLQLTVNAPPSAECDETNEHGKTRVDAINNRLYICTSTGWKFTTLQ